MIPTGELPQDLDRIFVASDGSIKAVYRDNSLLLLSSNAASFTRITAAGVKTVQLTECCLSRWKPLVAELLAFRNQHLDVPYFPPWLQKQLQDQPALVFSTGYPVTDTTWPATAEEAIEQDLVKLVDQYRLQLYSCCGSAFITLQYQALHFAVCYPLLLSHDPVTNTYTYLQHTQVFSRSQFPARWRHPLEIAAAAAELAAHDRPHLQNQQSPDGTTQQLPQQVQQLLQDVTNRLSLLSSSCSPCSKDFSAAGVHQQGAAGARGYCSSPVGYQHTRWQDLGPAQLPAPQQQHHLRTPTSIKACNSTPRSPHLAAVAGSSVRQSSALNGAAGRHAKWSPGASVSSIQPWCPPGSPGSPTAALYAVAEQQQQQQQEQALQLCNHQQLSSSAVPAVRLSSSLKWVVQLPVMIGVLQAVHQGQTEVGPPQSPPCGPGATLSATGQAGGSTSTRCCSAKGQIASALAEALGQCQQGSSGGTVGSWWLEPYLLLPTDELLNMVWSPDATYVYLEDTGEVEAWLHADDSCLFSFQGGTFVTHLQPQAGPTAQTVGTAALAAHSSLSPPAAPTAAGVAAAASPAEYRGTQHATAGSTAAPTATVGPAAARRLFEDQSCEGCQARTDATMQASRVYAVSALPVDLLVPSMSVYGQQQGIMLPLGRIVTDALRLRSTMARVRAAQGTSAHRDRMSAGAGASAGTKAHVCEGGHRLVCPSLHQQHYHQQPPEQLSLEVVEEQEVHGVGCFTAYADGRVRVVFADRTILSLDAGRGQAKLILADGSKREVAASRPVGVEDYVQAALEFATWSSHTPIQRAAALRMQAFVAAELRSSARMAAICEWGSNPQRAPELTRGEIGPHEGSKPLLLSDGPAAPCSVEHLLQANSALLQRL